jgi:hypothetical protein
MIHRLHTKFNKSEVHIRSSTVLIWCLLTDELLNDAFPKARITPKDNRERKTRKNEQGCDLEIGLGTIPTLASRD